MSIWPSSITCCLSSRPAKTATPPTSHSSSFLTLTRRNTWGNQWRSGTRKPSTWYTVGAGRRLVLLLTMLRNNSCSSLESRKNRRKIIQIIMINKCLKGCRLIPATQIFWSMTIVWQWLSAPKGPLPWRRCGIVLTMWYHQFERYLNLY